MPSQLTTVLHCCVNSATLRALFSRTLLRDRKTVDIVFRNRWPKCLHSIQDERQSGVERTKNGEQNQQHQRQKNLREKSATRRERNKHFCCTIFKDFVERSQTRACAKTSFQVEIIIKNYEISILFVLLSLSFLPSALTQVWVLVSTPPTRPPLQHSIFWPLNEVILYTLQTRHNEMIRHMKRNENENSVMSLLIWRCQRLYEVWNLFGIGKVAAHI